MSSKVFPVSSSSALSSSSSSPVLYIEHPVSKMDTLAGVAIKYGVEVADIKKLNGLVTDLQMFALKTLQIPLPGRHPPSPCLSTDADVISCRQSSSEQTPPQHMRSNCFDSFQSLRVTSDRKVSPAMSSLQGYYGLRPNARRNSYEGSKMAVYCDGRNCHDDGAGKPPAGLNLPLSLHRKSRSIANGFLMDDGEEGSDVLPAEARETESDKWIDKLVRRRQKSEADFICRTTEKLLKEENGNGGWFSAIAGKGLALRNKAVSKTNLTSETEWNGTNADSTGPDGISVFRKSSSTSSLQDQESGIPSLWQGSKWSLTPDLQALSTAAIARPIFDGLAKPKSGWKNKAALD